MNKPNGIFLFLLIASHSLCAGITGKAPSMKQAVSLASGTEDIIVLHHGSSWNEKGRILKKLWQSSTFKKHIKHVVQLDAPPTTSNELSEVDRKKLEKDSEKTGKGMDRLLAEFLNKGIKQKYKKIMNYPAISLFDSHGEFIGCTEGLEKMSPTSLVKVVNELKKKREKRDTYWAKAKNASGEKKATLLALGIREVIDSLPPENRRKNHQYLNYIYKKFEEIKSADSQDKTGYQRALNLEPFAFIAKVKKMYYESDKEKGTDSQHQETLKYINSELKDRKNKVLLPNQMQALYLLKYNLCKDSDPKSAKEVLLKGARLAPQSVLGFGLAGKYLIHFGNASIRSGWKERHLKDKKWIFGKDKALEDIKWYIKKPGPQLLKFSPSQNNGQISVLSVSLKSEKQTIYKSESSMKGTKNSPAIYKIEIPSNYRKYKTLTLEVRIGAGNIGAGRISFEPYSPLYDISDIYK